jgi:hypothetical protein
MITVKKKMHDFQKKPSANMPSETALYHPTALPELFNNEVLLGSKERTMENL